MCDNNVLDWYIELCGKIKYMFFKVYVVVYVLMVLCVVYFKVYYLIFYYCVYFFICVKVFELCIMSVGFDVVKVCMKDIIEKCQCNEVMNVENDFFMILELVNEMFECGFKFGKLDFYCSYVIDFIIEEDMLIFLFVVMEGLGENVVKQIVWVCEDGEFLLKIEFCK